MWYLMFIDDKGRIGLSGGDTSPAHSDRRTVEERAVSMTNVFGASMIRYFVCPACIVNMMRG